MVTWSSASGPRAQTKAPPGDAGLFPIKPEAPTSCGRVPTLPYAVLCGTSRLWVWGGHSTHGGRGIIIVG
jgi:hypothetical protein